MLKIKDLKVNLDKKTILNSIDLEIKKGEIHFLMGPNGAGKSTLGLVLMGHPDYKAHKGTIKFGKKYITNLSPNKRAKLGLFLGFQHSLEFEGVSLFNFLKTSLAAVSKKQDPLQLKQKTLSNLNLLGMDEKLFGRYLNFGFSGGEKKKSEILQLLTLKPKLAILDEPDSGLDIDALKAVVKAIKVLNKKDETAFLIITHQSLIGKYLKPDKVHVMIDGSIKKQAGPDLVKYIGKYGYKNF